MGLFSGSAKSPASRKGAKKKKQTRANNKRAAGAAKAKAFTPPAWRHYLLIMVFASASAAVAARVVMLGVNEREFLTAQGDARSIRSEAMPAHRGVIYDRHGEPLAVSTPVTSVWVDPRLATYSLEQTGALANVLSLDAEKLGDLLLANRERGFLWLSRRVDPAVAEKVEALDLPASIRRVKQLRTCWV